MLGRPKAMSVRNNQGSVSTYVPLNREKSQTSGGGGRLRSTSTLSQSDVPLEGQDEVVHPVQAKASTANLPPVMSKMADEHPLSWVGFEEHCIITACKDGESIEFCDNGSLQERVLTKMCSVRPHSRMGPPEGWR